MYSSNLPSLQSLTPQTYGDPSSAKFGRARDRFLESLAGYSIISYLLQIKDRHNGNILLSSDGRIIRTSSVRTKRRRSLLTQLTCHAPADIDFGFMLGISPGGVGFEAAPFKLTQEYIDILGGIDSAKFDEFKQLMRQGFKDVRKHAERIIMIVELMQKGGWVVLLQLRVPHADTVTNVNTCRLEATMFRPRRLYRFQSA